MSENLQSLARAFNVRPLQEHDLDAVVALDRRITGGSRRGYFERRVASALRDPRDHVQVGAATGAGLAGFMLARVASGEYGRPEATGVVEALGVDPSQQHAGVGRAMLASLEQALQARGVASLVTQVDWRDHAMLRFLDGAGFSLAARWVLERRVARMSLPPTDEEIEQFPPIVRHLRADDFDAVVRIDRQATGRERGDYFRRKFDEVLRESAIEVSLVVEDDGFAVGFAMARVDLGDFGHVETTAELDTIGIAPAFAHKGYARAMLGQLIDNLAALHVERLKTEVAHDHHELLRFLYRFGFAPSQRLVLHARRTPRAS